MYYDTMANNTMAKAKVLWQNLISQKGAVMDFVKASALTAEILSKQPTGIPIFLCSAAPRAVRKLSESGYKHLSLNKELSSSLMAIPQEKRLSVVQQETQKIISKAGSAVLLSDYEMLFDPRYKIDVLKLFCELARTTRLAVKWCGTTAEDSLEYAEPQYTDHQTYQLANYTVICVK